MIGLAIVYFLKWLGEAGDTAAKVGGYSLGLATSFVLNRNGTFYHSGPWLPAFVRFLSVFVIAYASNLGTVLALIAQFGTNGYIAGVWCSAIHNAFFISATGTSHSQNGGSCLETRTCSTRTQRLGRGFANIILPSSCKGNRFSIAGIVAPRPRSTRSNA
jgi:putative flippase GtrA